MQQIANWPETGARTVCMDDTSVLRKLASHLLHNLTFMCAAKRALNPAATRHSYSPGPGTQRQSPPSQCRKEAVQVGATCAAPTVRAHTWEHTHTHTHAHTPHVPKNSQHMHACTASQHHLVRPGT